MQRTYPPLPTRYRIVVAADVRLRKHCSRLPVEQTQLLIFRHLSGIVAPDYSERLSRIQLRGDELPPIRRAGGRRTFFATFTFRVFRSSRVQRLCR